MRTRLSLVILLLAMATFSARPAFNVNLDSALQVLDREIAVRQNYSNAKEAHINSVRSRLKPSQDDISNFGVLDMLYEEFRQYQSDSAFHYSNLLYEIAETSHDEPLLAVARATKFDYYMSVWQLDDAMSMYRKIDSSLLPVRERLGFYENCINLFYRLSLEASETDQQLYENYQTACDQYIDSIVGISAPGSFEHEFYNLHITESGGVSYDEVLQHRFDLINEFEFSDSELAVIYASMGGFANLNGDSQREAYFNAMSTIYDIRSSTHETASVYMLANLMNRLGENDRAVRYIRVAFDDALFFNSRMKQSQIGMMLPLLETIRYDHIFGQRSIMAILLVLITLSLCVLGLLFSKLSRRNKRLAQMSLSLNEAQHELVQANDALSSLNVKLKESIELKDSYIMQSLYINTSFLNQVEARCREAINNMKTKGLEAMRFLPYQMGIKEERQRIMQSFDQTFLQVFPNFIDDFNAILNEGESVALAPDGGLSTELRIFALMRLGVNDTSTVAGFLNISPNSIYVYKARLKAKSNLSKSDFDARIMAIKKT